jgi:hypothetical protein
MNPDTRKVPWYIGLGPLLATLINLVLALSLFAGLAGAEHDRAIRQQCLTLAPGTAVAVERACQDEQRAAFAYHRDPPTRWHESLWGFRLMVAEQLDAGRIQPGEANWAMQDYQRRLEVEANQTQAAMDSARAAELGNYLAVWSRYFGPRR